MGCCLTTTHKPPPPPSQKEEPNHHHPHPHRHHRRHFHQTSPSPKLEPTQTVSPPHPPVVEEESVKEVVLSETPVSKPPTPEAPIPEKRKTHAQAHLPLKLEREAKEISEASRVSESCECEVSESFSYSTTTTTTITEVRDDDEAMSKRRREVGPRVTAAVTRRKRPNSGELAGRRGRGHVSHVSNVERSSSKKNRVEGGGKAAVRGRESGQVPVAQRNNGGGNGAGVQRDVGEVSSRRSRSPATRSAGGVSRGGLARNGSMGTGRAGGHLQAEAVQNGDGKNKKEEVSKEGCSQVGNESLENPLVSLECFIFV